MTQDPAEQLRSDVDALRYYDSLGLELPAKFLEALSPRLTQPSLVVLGYGHGVLPWALTPLIHRLAQMGLRQGRSVSVVSGRDWTQELRAACLVGMRATRRLARERPTLDDPELDSRKYLGDLASPDLRLTVQGVEELSRGICQPGPGPVDIWLIDDIAGVERLLSKTTTDPSVALDPSPLGLRHLSRQKMCSLVVTVDWRLTDRWRWAREADAVLDVVSDDDDSPVIRAGLTTEHLPMPEGRR